MEIPNKWKEAINVRTSTRSYDNRVLKKDDRKKIKEFIKSLNNNFNGVRAVLVEDGGDKVIQSIIGSYGLFKGVGSYIAFIADENDKHYFEKIGYIGEMCVLEATSLGLATCWVGGTFKPKVVERQIVIEFNEKVVAITPLGYKIDKKRFIERLIKKSVGSYKRKSLGELCSGGYNQEWPEWIRDALQLARIAPSAVNKQPWRFTVSEDNKSIKVSVDNTINESNRLDCGIAMLHIEVGALSSGIKGEWCYLDQGDVAVFRVS